ncbi:MAG: ATP synthase F0 subunit B [Proteobacteria bacterium]|nr:ATP synthase F0 subunit B [Pseudomonadota bacterium]MCP4918662.1 ATP synthase F0 subunit B [Pseudomonadota bacterium]
MLLAVIDVALAAGDAHGEGGIPFTDIGIHAFNFVFLYAVLFFIARKPVAELLKARQADVRQALEKGHAALKAAEDRNGDIASKLSHFDKEVTGLRLNAERDIGAERTLVKERTAADIAALEALTDRNIAEARRNARVKLQRDAVDAAVAAAEEQIRGQLNKDDKTRLAGDFLAAVDAEAANG